jgi:predicted secreted protein
MKNFAAAWSGVALAAFIWAGAATASSHSSETARLAVGASTTIVLSENPSTGYRWQINKGQSANLRIVQIRDAGYQPGSSHRMGAPGTHRWRIKALAAGSARIVFDYARPWEHGAPARRHTVRVEIN